MAKPGGPFPLLRGVQICPKCGEKMHHIVEVDLQNKKHDYLMCPCIFAALGKFAASGGTP